MRAIHVRCLEMPLRAMNGTHRIASPICVQVCGIGFPPLPGLERDCPGGDLSRVEPR
ncbi:MULTISPECIES: hypothetical protein [Brevibacillus]|uniref:hypothetical protein n=1 Tax=Brevibacillus TaxID=55080 RepID=UPI001606990D|nr:MULTISPECIES: hypothetical protein [Brevibacillus]MCM3080851.1 hypothetical protein [Brevibacillus invocatus]MCM3431038.1 hypothetical protein [Brevibacillus invocatus]MDH4618818.1 hypothetical protein [Brevibacillus sp. AY1]